MLQKVTKVHRKTIKEGIGQYYKHKPLTNSRMVEALKRVKENLFYDIYIPWTRIVAVESYRYVGYFKVSSGGLGMQPTIYVTTIYDYSDFELDSLIAHELIHVIEYMHCNTCSHGKFFKRLAKLITNRGIEVNEYADYMNNAKLSKKASYARMKFGDFSNLFSEPTQL